MDEESLKRTAAQLRKPSGEDGIKIGEWMNQGNLHINLQAIEAMGASDQHQVLEIGMGNGYFVEKILEPNSGVSYTGCDFSEIMVQEANLRNKNWIEKGRARFVLADVEMLPFEDQQFDRILTINTLYFWNDPAKVFQEFRRVLKKEGQIIIAIRPKALMQSFPMTKYGFTMYSADDLKDLLRKNGLTLLSLSENKEPEYEMEGMKIKMENCIAIVGA